MAGKKVRVFKYDPVLFDRLNVSLLEPGDLVVKTQPYGCPKNGAMGMCYVQDAESGEFKGMVMLNSLTPTAKTAVKRDLAAEARDARSAALRR